MGISIAFQFDVRIEIQKTDKLINLTPHILFFFFNFGDFFTLKCTCPFEQVASNINFHYFFFNWFREIGQALMSSPAIINSLKPMHCDLFTLYLSLGLVLDNFPTQWPTHKSQDVGGLDAWAVTTGVAHLLPPHGCPPRLCQHITLIWNKLCKMSTEIN